MRYYIVTNGCTRRRLDADRLGRYMVANGARQAWLPRWADWVFLVTCGAFERVENESFDLLRALRRHRGRLVVLGCVPGTNPERLREAFGGPAIPAGRMEEIEQLFPEFEVPLGAVADANAIYSVRARKLIGRRPDAGALRYVYTRSHVVAKVVDWLRGRSGGQSGLRPVEPVASAFTLRISEGCVGACTFCAIRDAIGSLKSKPLDVAVGELHGALAQRNYGLNVVASDSGSYGLDIGSTLPELLSAVLALDDRLYVEFVEDLHPQWICRYSRELTELAATGRIRSILTPLQSGSPRVLELMRRPTDLEAFAGALGRLRAASPALRLRTCAIVGFPTETDADVGQTIEFLRRSRFDHVDLLAYHETSTMDSATLKPKVPHEEAVRRIERIRQSLGSIWVNVSH